MCYVMKYSAGKSEQWHKNWIFIQFIFDFFFYMHVWLKHLLGVNLKMQMFHNYFMADCVSSNIYSKFSILTFSYLQTI